MTARQGPWSVNVTCRQCGGLIGAEVGLDDEQRDRVEAYWLTEVRAHAAAHAQHEGAVDIELVWRWVRP